MKKLMNIVSNPPFNDESHYSEMKVGERDSQIKLHQTLSRSMAEASDGDNVVFVLPRFGKSLVNEMFK